MRTTPRRLVSITALTAALLMGGGPALAAVTDAPEAAGTESAEPDPWRELEYWLEDYGYTAAWERSRGEGVTVAVIDTGVDGGHPDLTGQVVGGSDFSGLGGEDGQLPIGTDAEHGTLVASLLAGHGHDPDGGTGPGDAGVLGVAPEARLLSASVHLSADEFGGPSAEEQIPEAVIWAVDQGADVINMSLVSTRTDWPESWDEAFLYAEQHDVVVVAAAGNRASGTLTAGAPATIPGVLTVAGLDAQGQASWDASTEGISIGVAAPADPLIGATPGGGHREWMGTSGAAPLVAGLAALIRSAYPDLPAHQVIHRIRATARDAGDPGVDPVYGYGIIDAEAALSADVPAVERAAEDSLEEWIRVNRRAAAQNPSDVGSTSSPPAAAGPATTAAPSGQPTEIPQASAEENPAPWLAPTLVLGSIAGVLVCVVAAVVTFRKGSRTRR